MIEQQSFKSVFQPDCQRELKEAVKGKELKAVERWKLIRGRREDLRIVFSLGMRMKDVFMGKKSLSAQDQDLMEIMNGEHSRILGDKTQFPHLLRELGYSSPNGIVVYCTDDVSTKKEKVSTYFGGNDGIRLFAKPVNGTWQRNLIGLEPVQKVLLA